MTFSCGVVENIGHIKTSLFLFTFCFYLGERRDHEQIFLGYLRTRLKEKFEDIICLLQQQYQSQIAAGTRCMPVEYHTLLQKHYILFNPYKNFMRHKYCSYPHCVEFRFFRMILCTGLICFDSYNLFGFALSLSFSSRR